MGFKERREKEKSERMKVWALRLLAMAAAAVAVVLIVCYSIPGFSLKLGSGDDDALKGENDAYLASNGDAIMLYAITGAAVEDESASGDDAAGDSGESQDQEEPSVIEMERDETGNVYVAGTEPEEEDDSEEGDQDAEEPAFTEAESVPRGTIVEDQQKLCLIVLTTGEIMYEFDKNEVDTSEYRGTIETEDGDAATFYEQIVYNGGTYYVDPDVLTRDKDDIVRETELYVRTSVTVYETNDSADIASFIKKGSALTINGYDTVDSDGEVRMYDITCGDISGWVYGKYLVTTKEEADSVSEYAQYHTNKDFSYELYGGEAETLDYFPYERETFDYDMLTECRGMYICIEAMNNWEDYLELAKESGVNAVVIDIKDGWLAYKSDVAAEYSPTSNLDVGMEVSEFAEGVKAFQDAGIYVIGRIVAFKDTMYATDHPEDCIYSEEYTTSEWPSVFCRNVWEYNVKLALEAIEWFDLQEIQFDYCRFPESTYEISEYDDEADFRNEYNEEKAEAIQNFCFYATDMIHEKNTYVSVDVFGESVNDYVPAYGQYWPAISNIVDAISGMPYTDHYGSSVDTWSEPYETVLTFAKNAAAYQEQIPTPGVARTWITGYDTPNWNPTVEYGYDKMMEQIQALKDGGLSGGFMPWNGGSDIDTYKEYSKIWNAS